MEIVRMNRGTGKTTELIKKSNEKCIPIICADINRVKYISDYAKKLNINIPRPLPVNQLIQNKHIFRGVKFTTVLVDDIENVLGSVLGIKIDKATTSSNILVK